MSMTTKLPALLLVAHGSSDPQWRTPLDELHALIVAQQPGVDSALAFISKASPSPDEAIDAFVARGVLDIQVQVVLLSAGGLHFKEDLPAIVRAAQERHPKLNVHLLDQPLGTYRSVLDAMAKESCCALKSVRAGTNTEIE